jgi:pyrroline-5-carboxylate reductase
MKNIKIAVIGAVNMGSALIKGVVRAKQVAPGSITATDAKPARLLELKKEFKVKTSKSNPEAAKTADVVVLAVKPQILDKVLAELRKSRKQDALFLSMAAGYPTALIEKLLGGSPRVVRAMPNIAAAVGQAATALCRGKHARKKELDLARQMFQSCGTVEEVDESLMDAVTGLSGTGPMYVFIIIEALSDAGVKVGLGRDIATRLAVQTVLGAAGMVEKTGQHPIFLKDLVTSPGGTAINALYSMEKTGLRAVIMDAVEAATRRSRELGRPFEDTANS